MKKLTFILFATLFISPTWAEGDPSKGEEIFKHNCAECHLKTDFRGMSVDMIETRMKSTTGTDEMHESGLTMLSQQERDDIAAYFANAGNTGADSKTLDSETLKAAKSTEASGISAAE